MRFVAQPSDDGRLAVAPDLTGKLPGRGAWVAASRDALALAAKRNAFSRAFKAPAAAPADLVETVEAGLFRLAAEALGLARRVGDLVTGYEKVRAALKNGKAACLITACDSGADGRDKLAALAGATHRVTCFSSAELSAALGGVNVVHAAIRPGAAADRVVRAAGRLEGFRPTAHAG